jgi:hypothetical protein
MFIAASNHRKLTEEITRLYQMVAYGGTWLGNLTESKLEPILNQLPSHVVLYSNPSRNRLKILCDVGATNGGDKFCAVSLGSFAEPSLGANRSLRGAGLADGGDVYALVVELVAELLSASLDETSRRLFVEAKKPDLWGLVTLIRQRVSDILHVRHYRATYNLLEQRRPCRWVDRFEQIVFS